MKKEKQSPTQQMIDDNTIGIGELDEYELKTYEDVHPQRVTFKAMVSIIGKHIKYWKI